ncbi:ABC transporter permease [Microbacterium sp. YY-03]|uniref:ABC transporter permease n=1 Tax=Microbacterium sp. YY-03 TaxID=3421636 RepID=UPI003D1666ED
MSTQRAGWFRPLWRSTTGKFGVIVVALVALTALVSLFWTPFPPELANVDDRWLGPGWPHVLGTDNAGRDMLTHIMLGARTTVVVAIGAAVISTVIGIALACLATLTTRLVREAMATLIDVLLAFPVLIIAAMLASIAGQSLWVVVFAVGIGFGVNMARVTRPELRRVLSSDYVLAGKAAGLTTSQNVFRHVLPNIAPVYIVQLSWSMGVAVLAEAGLSYIGFGASANDPSWGRLLAETQAFINIHPLAVIWPGLAISLTVLALNLLGDKLRETTDPTLSQRMAKAMPAPMPTVTA